MVNDNTFGVTFDGWHEAGDTINIDCVQITITYTTGGTPAEGVCDGIPCGESMSFEDAIKALLTKYSVEGFDCVGLKLAPALTKCSDLTDLTKCGVQYTLEGALKAALRNDGCTGWVLRVFVLPPDRGDN
jgi:hypothetical protein